MNRPLPSILIQGFRLALRNWPLVLYAYAANLVFGLIAGMPFTAGLAPWLDHSLAAEKIGGTIDLAYLGELTKHLRDSSFLVMAAHSAGWIDLLQLIVLFVLFAGTTFVYVSAEPPRLSVVLRGGVAYFWRFVQAAVMAGLPAMLIVLILLVVREAALARGSSRYFDRQLFVYAVASTALVLLAGLLLRLWWDLVEVYVVHNAMDGERRVRQALLPAFRLLSRYFFRACGSFLLAGVAGLSGLAFCGFLWRTLVPAHQVWMAFLLAQLGLFLLLASRFWQRGIEAALVMSADPPRLAAEEIAVGEEDEVLREPEETGVLARGSEPTLRELVLKLRTEPLANPEVLLPPPPVDAASLIESHETKFPLGGIIAVEPPVKEDKVLDRERSTLPEKKS